MKVDWASMRFCHVCKEEWMYRTKGKNWLKDWTKCLWKWHFFQMSCCCFWAALEFLSVFLWKLENAGMPRNQSDFCWMKYCYNQTWEVVYALECSFWQWVYYCLYVGVSRSGVSVCLIVSVCTSLCVCIWKKGREGWRGKNYQDREAERKFYTCFCVHIDVMFYVWNIFQYFSSSTDHPCLHCWSASILSDMICHILYVLNCDWRLSSTQQPYLSTIWDKKTIHV